MSGRFAPFTQRVSRVAAIAVVAALAVASCKRAEPIAKPSQVDAAVASTSVASAAPSPRTPAAPVAPVELTDAAARIGDGGGSAYSAGALAGFDAGASACKRIEGPLPALPARFVERSGLRAGAFEYAQDSTGSVRRKAGEGAGRLVGEARPGSRIAVAPIGDGHSVMAFLANRKTSEGIQSQAFIVLDEGEPLRLSEEGSGATFVELAQRGRDVVAVLIDARIAMTPAHARIVSLAGDKLALGTDAVVFIGGTPERRTTAAIATSSRKTAFVLLAMAEGVSTFGMATIRVDDPPKDDAPVTWSLYPNGLDPAPVATTHGGDTMYFARVRPAFADRGSVRVLELGRLGDDGVSTLLGTYAASATLKNIVVDVDAKGVVSLFYDDGQGAWVQRLTCAG